jgi:pyruvate dehydrogenase E1 component alpha subunit
MGGDLYRLLAEVLGKDDGCSRGMGGSMHLYAPAEGLLGTVPIVAGTISLAVGAALAAKKDGRGDIAVAYFGDGASEEGALHESLNLAAVWGLPILFVCENNLFSSHMHISLRQPANRVARYAEAHCIPAITMDGNDVVAVSAATKQLVERARSGGGPGFLEAVTYRWRGHVGHREDEDVGVDRGTSLVHWKQRDPVRRLADALIDADELSPAALAELDASITAEVDELWKRAEQAPYPDAAATMDRVYADRADA